MKRAHDITLLILVLFFLCYKTVVILMLLGGITSFVIGFDFLLVFKEGILIILPWRDASFFVVSTVANFTIVVSYGL